jgi:hypothetical protein
MVRFPPIEIRLTHTPGHAADIAGFEAGDDFLRRSADGGLFGWGTISQGLMRPFPVVVVSVLPQDPAETAVIQEPAAADALVLDGAHPALGDGIAVGTARGNGYRFDTGIAKSLLPVCAELGIPVVDQVAAAHALQPPCPIHGGVPGRLDHIRLVAVLGDAQDLNLPGGVVDGEEHVVGAFDRPEPAPDPGLHGEKVGSAEVIGFLSHEAPPSPIGGTLGGRLEPVARENRSDGTRGDGQEAQGQDGGNALLPPQGVLLGQAANDLFDGGMDAWSATPGPLDAQLAGLPQAFPTPDGRALGHSGDPAHLLPSSDGSERRPSPSEAQSPGVGEGQAAVRRQKFAVVGDLGALKCDLGEQELVLSSGNAGGNQAGQESNVVHHETVESALENLWDNPCYGMAA